MVVSSRSKLIVSVAEKLDIDKTVSLSSSSSFPSSLQFTQKISQSEFEAIFSITRNNMEAIYNACNDAVWQWNDETKKRELGNLKNRFLIKRSPNHNNEIIGFIVFRFMVDDGLPVAYIWEIQVVEIGRGTGSELMDNFENFLKQNTAIRKIVLTVLRNNEKAFQFYEKRGYVIDRTSPKSACYQILSKSI